MRNALLNMDGLGVAWYTNAATSYLKSVSGKRPALYKSQSPPCSDFNLRALCANIETTCVFAHVRAGSGGAVTQVNTHPFLFGRHLFMHNGVISKFGPMKRQLIDLLSDETYARISGSTDSEHAAALYMTNLTSSGDEASWEKEYTVAEMVQALVVTVVQIMQMQKDLFGEDRWPNSLNICVGDGKKMVAIRFRNSVKAEPPSLYWSSSAGKTLNSKYPGHPDGSDLVNEEAIKTAEEPMGKHTIIASEPTTYDEKEWHLIGKNCVFTVDETGTEMEHPISYDETLNAAEPNFKWPPK